MAGQQLPDDLFAYLRELERRLVALERTPQTANVSTTTHGPQAAEVLDNDDTASGSYVDLAHPGPTVNVVVPQSGLLVVLYGHEANSGGGSRGYMNFELSGANTRAPVDSDAVSLMPVTSGGFTVTGHVARQKRLSGLQPGLTTVTAKYRLQSGANAWFANRWVLAMPL